MLPGRLRTEFQLKRHGVRRVTEIQPDRNVQLYCIRREQQEGEQAAFGSLSQSGYVYR